MQTKNMNNKINILGINVNTYPQSEILKMIENFIKSDEQHYVVTPNPEIILKALSDEEYFTILNLADLSLPDGIGLKFAAWCLGFNLKRVIGSDLTCELLRISENNNYRIGIVNWIDGLSKKEDINEHLKNTYPKLQFLVIDIQKDSEIDYTEMNDFSPSLIFVSLGAPWQEKFMYHELKNIPSVKIALGIGGAFDFLTGKTKRAPRIFSFLGFEWLWRAIKQPAGQKLWRLKRIGRAVFVFPYKFIRWRFLYPLIYRKNIACLLFRKNRLARSGTEVLLVERREDPGHWQIPQGGTDGLEPSKAGAKELKEELGTENFVAKEIFPNLYKYEFYDPKQIANYRGGTYMKHAGYRGQKQSLFIARFLGTDDEIKVNFWDHSNWKWVDSFDAISAVHPSRKEGMKIFMNKLHPKGANSGREFVKIKIP